LIRKYCKICCIEHKERPESFCIALHNGKINDEETKTNIVMDILKLSPELENKYFGKTRSKI